MSLRKEFNKQNEPNFEYEEKEVNITYDGKQLLARIPTEIAKLKDIKKGDKLKFRFEFPEYSAQQKDGKLIIEYVRK